jgi:hypothetical protein
VLEVLVKCKRSAVAAFEQATPKYGTVGAAAATKLQSPKIKSEPLEPGETIPASMFTGTPTYKVVVMDEVEPKTKEPHA